MTLLEHTRTPRRTQGLAIITLTYSAAIVSIMQTLALPLVPLMPSLFHESISASSWAATGATLAGAIANPVLGRAGEIYGKKRVMLLALGSLTVGSVLCAIAWNLPILIAGRVLQGVAVGCIALALGIARESLSGKNIATATASIGAMMGVGAGIGVPMAGVLVQAGDWRSIFWVSAGLGILGMSTTAVFVPAGPRGLGRLDIVGSLGVALAAALLLTAVTYSTEWGFSSPVFIVVCCLIPVIGIPWVIHQRSALDPVVDLRLLARPQVARLHVLGLLVGFTMFGNFASAIQVVVFPKPGFGGDLLMAGLLMLPATTIGLLLIGPVAVMTRRLGSRTVLVCALLFSITGNVARALWPEQPWQLAIGFALVSVGTSMAFATIPMLLAPHLPPGTTSAVNGVNNLFRQIGSSLGNSVNAAVISAAAVLGAAATALAFNLLAFAGAAAMGIGLLLALLSSSIPGQRPSE
ncbi:MFS transporter [Arthrobacter sp. NPDC080031]|uniref:MFS transporter n=1 Tax=Arthrobacter sp. NPDC080031 TaxID=3155918 RepID=UPI00344DDD7B